MKTILITFGLILTMQAWAQYTVAPFGSGSSSVPPIGQNRKNACAGGACNFEINLKPYCFGTNLRAYAVENQLSPSQNVSMNISLTDPKSKKSDSLTVEFPAKLTYASKGVSVDCNFVPGQNLNEPGYKEISCYVPWAGKDFTYMLSRWLESTNPQNNPYLGADFNKYAGAPLPAVIKGAVVEGVDGNLSCFYKFTTNNKNGTLKKDSVSCFFPNTLPDYSKDVKVSKDGSPLSPGEYEITAYSNNIKIKLKTAVNAIAGNNSVKHGKLVLTTPPSHRISYSQASNNTQRNLAAQREIESFDEATGYKSFTAQVKFPGMEGFCGGYYSPLMFFFDNQFPQFTGISLFNLYGVEPGTRVHWPEASHSGFFLAHLPHKDSKITSSEQLFGQNKEFGNGFEALAVHDKNKDNVIDKKDPVFKELKLWNDKNGNGIAEDKEIYSLSQMNVTEISLKYNTRNPSNFAGRAHAREKSSFKFKSKDGMKRGEVFDVWLAPID